MLPAGCVVGRAVADRRMILAGYRLADLLIRMLEIGTRLAQRSLALQPGNSLVSLALTGRLQHVDYSSCCYPS